MMIVAAGLPCSTQVTARAGWAHAATIPIEVSLAMQLRPSSFTDPR